MAWSRYKPLSPGTCLAYGLGHTQLALVAGMLDTYLLLYLQFVVELPAATAGVIYMLGQLFDGFMTPLVALRTDRTQWSFYGKRKMVHLVGTIMISLTFPFIFVKCIGCEGGSYWTLVAYFVPLLCLVQSSWAAVKMSHLSLIPELTNIGRVRDELNIVRYSIEILASTMVYMVIYTLLNANQGSEVVAQGIGPGSAGIFLDVALIVAGLGLFFTIPFQIFTPEENGFRDTAKISTTKTMAWNDWLKQPRFYKVAILHALAELITGMLQAFVPLYLQLETQTSLDSLAVVPLIMTISGFLSSVLTKPILHYWLDKKSLFILCGIIGISGATWLASIDPMVTSAWSIYGIAVLFGMGGSTMLLLALGFAADLVGDQTSSSGFVYSFLNLTERIVSGGTILAFQTGKGYCLTCSTYYRDSLYYGITTFTAVSLLIALSLKGKEISIDDILSGSADDDDRGVCSRLISENTKLKYGATRQISPSKDDG